MAKKPKAAKSALAKRRISHVKKMAKKDGK
jgi:hypothetical protein